MTVETHSPTSAAETTHVETPAPAEGLAMFGLNVPSFLAQLFNFAIVLFVLTKWVFKPALKALDARRAHIEASVKTAAAADERLAGADQEAERIVAKARVDATKRLEQVAVDEEAMKARMLAEAKSEVERVIEAARRTIATEQEAARQKLKAEVADLAIEAAARIVGDGLDRKRARTIALEAVEGWKNAAARDEAK